MKTSFLLWVTFIALTLPGCGSGSSGNALSCGPGTTNANGACVPTAGTGGGSAGAGGSAPAKGGAGGMSTVGGGGSAGNSGGFAGSAGVSAGGAAGTTGWACAPAPSMPLPWMSGSDPKDGPCDGLFVNCSGTCSPEVFTSQHAQCFDPAAGCSAGIAPEPDVFGAPGALKRGLDLLLRTPSHPGTMQLTCAPFCEIDLATFLGAGYVYAFHARVPIEANYPGEGGTATVVWYTPPGWFVFVPGYSLGKHAGLPPCTYDLTYAPQGFVDVVIATTNPDAVSKNVSLYWANTSNPSNPHSAWAVHQRCKMEHPL